MVTVEFDSMGEAFRLALVAGEYAGGGLAVLLLDATDPRSEGYMAEWGVLTANVPAAAEWCRGRGDIAIDADGQRKIGESVAAAFAATGADAVVTACPLCKKGIARGNSMPVYDLAEIVAQAL